MADHDDDLGELLYRHHHELDPVKRASLAAKIRALKAQQTASGPPVADADPPASIRSGVLSRPEAPTSTTPARPRPERPWRLVRVIAATDVLGLRLRD